MRGPLMKKIILGGGLVASLALGFFFVTEPVVKDYLSQQMAAVVGIDSWAVYDFEKQRGIRRHIAMGASGKDVRLVQEALAGFHDFPEENITGYFGEQTSATLKEYQKAHGLEQTGVVDEDTRESLNELYFSELCPEGDGESSKEELLTHVNKDKKLPKGYVPEDLVDISKIVKTTGLICLKQDVTAPLKKMFEAAAKDGYVLAVTSGFRNPEVQKVLYWIWMSYEGENAKDRVAEPRHSEHQLGTAIDLTASSNTNKSADLGFALTPEYAWLQKHAHEYGFVMSYPEKKQQITGYDYEPWHWRYVGTKPAKQIYKEKISVEEYLEEEE